MKQFMKQYVKCTITACMLMPFSALADTSPVSPLPIPAGYPNAATTGLAGVGLTKADLTVYTGNTALKGVQVFEKMSFPSGVVLENNSNITFRKCFIGGVKYGVKMYDNSQVLLEDCTLVGGNNPDRLGAGVRPASNCKTTILRCDVSHYCDGLKLKSNTTVKDSYVHNLHKNSLSHNDGMQAGTDSDNIIVSHNTVMGRYRQNQSCIRIIANGGKNENVLVEKNYLSGGQYPLQVSAKTDKGGVCPGPDAIIQYNIVEKDSWPQDKSRQAFDICGNPILTCNYHHDGTPIRSVGSCTFKEALAAAASGGTVPLPDPEIFHGESQAAGLHFLMYPNPLTIAPRITFALEGPGFVSLKLYTLRGEELRTLAAGNFTKGTHQVKLITDELESGMYVTRFSSAQGFITKEVMLIK